MPTIKVKDLMTEYFKPDKSDDVLLSFLSLPSRAEDCIEVVGSEEEWSVVENPTRLHKKYAFQQISNRNRFVEELLFYEEQTNHYADIKINGLEVFVEVYTHDLDSITELDEEYAANADETFIELRYSLVR